MSPLAYTKLQYPQRWHFVTHKVVDPLINIGRSNLLTGACKLLDDPIY